MVAETVLKIISLVLTDTWNKNVKYFSFFFTDLMCLNPGTSSLVSLLLKHSHFPISRISFEDFFSKHM